MVRWILVLIGAFGIFLLIFSLVNLRDLFEQVNSTTASLVIDSCKISGITMLCKARLVVRSSLVYDVELAQLKLTNLSGKYIDSWSGEIKDRNNFTISFSKNELFSDKSRRFLIDGFVKVNFLIGRNGLKINLPVKAEVSVVGRKE
ncbi:MAG: hypothetical protein ABDH59_00590 [Fervidobacterium sp.]